MMSSETLLLAIILLPFLGSLLAAFLPSAARNAAAALAGTTAVAGLAATIFLYRTVSSGAVLRSEIEWLPSLGLDLLIRLGGLSWLFAVLVFGIGALVVLYARYYMSAADPVRASSPSCWHSWDRCWASSCPATSSSSPSSGS